MCYFPLSKTENLVINHDYKTVSKFFHKERIDGLASTRLSPHFPRSVILSTIKNKAKIKQLLFHMLEYGPHLVT